MTNQIENTSEVVKPKRAKHPNSGFRKGHPRHGGIQKGKKHNPTEKILKDMDKAYKEIGGEDAMIKYAKGDKGVNSDFIKDYIKLRFSNSLKVTDKPSKRVFVEDTDN
jgi:hypothetical protein